MPWLVSDLQDDEITSQYSVSKVRVGNMKQFPTARTPDDLIWATARVLVITATFSTPMKWRGL